MLCRSYEPVPGFRENQRLAGLAPFRNRGRFEGRSGSVGEAAISFGVLILFSGNAFGLWFPDLGMQIPPYLIAPVAMWMAFRNGNKSALIGMALVSAFAVLGTVNGRGPFTEGTLNEKLLMVQAFITSITVTVLGLSASLAERDRAFREVRLANALLEGKVAERTEVLERQTSDLHRSNADLEAFNRHAVSREMRVIEFKDEVDGLRSELERALALVPSKPGGGN